MSRSLGGGVCGRPAACTRKPETREQTMWNHTARTAVIVAVAAITACATAQPLYHVRDTGPELEALFPGNQFLSSQFRGMNQNGDAVGEVHLDSVDQECFIYTVELGVT